MTRTFTLSALLLTAIVAWQATPAEAQCANGAWVCADVRIGGSWHVGPPRQVYVVEPAPPPPPQVVVVERPAPPPRVVVVQQPTTYAVTTTTTTTMVPRLELGINARVAGMFGNNVHMVGAHGAFRIRPAQGRFAIDLGVGAYGGRDWNDLDRFEVPVTADFLLFVNPQNELQFYLLGGVGASFAHTSGVDPVTGQIDRQYAYVGGEVGLGLEWRLSQHWALNADVRGFVRQRVDPETAPEFVDLENNRSTDTSGGAVGSLGVTFYFN
jgi:hypothetical protein